MAIVDPFGNRCDKVLRLHFRQVNHTHFDVFREVARAQRIFGKYSIFLQAASYLALKLSNNDLSRFVVVTTECSEGVESTEQNELYNRFGVQDLSSVTVFLVQLIRRPIKPPLLPPTYGFDGCASHRPGRAAVYLDSFTEGHVLAHELIHVLLEHAPYRLRLHSTNPNNVLLEGSLRTMTPKDARLNIQQLEFVRRSPLLQAC